MLFLRLNRTLPRRKTGKKTKGENGRILTRKRTGKAGGENDSANAEKGKSRRKTLEKRLAKNWGLTKNGSSAIITNVVFNMHKNAPIQLGKKTNEIDFPSIESFLESGRLRLQSQSEVMT